MNSYGKWFPKKLHSLNLTQKQYEEAGRKFLNEESVKKGVKHTHILDSEAEILGRLLWRVHLASITQKCDNDSQKSVTNTMNHELALMKKVHSIQSTLSPSTISPTACEISNTTCPTSYKIKTYHRFNDRYRFRFYFIIGQIKIHEFIYHHHLFQQEHIVVILPIIIYEILIKNLDHIILYGIYFNCIRLILIY